MHLILCMSPIGDAFRNRLRQYPSLINCTTIDWFLEWPREALLEVGNKFLMNLNLTLTITGENKVVGTPYPFPRDRFHSIRFLRSTRVSYHQSSIPPPAPVLLADHFSESDYFPIYGLPLIIRTSGAFLPRRGRGRDWSLGILENVFDIHNSSACLRMLRTCFRTRVPRVKFYRANAPKDFVAIRQILRHRTNIPSPTINPYNFYIFLI